MQITKLKKKKLNNRKKEEEGEKMQIYIPNELLTMICENLILINPKFLDVFGLVCRQWHEIATMNTVFLFDSLIIHSKTNDSPAKRQSKILHLPPTHYNICKGTEILLRSKNDHLFDTMLIYSFTDRGVKFARKFEKLMNLFPSVFLISLEKERKKFDRKKRLKKLNFWINVKMFKVKIIDNVNDHPFIIPTKEEWLIKRQKQHQNEEEEQLRDVNFCWKLKDESNQIQVLHTISELLYEMKWKIVDEKLTMDGDDSKECWKLESHRLVKKKNIPRFLSHNRFGKRRPITNNNTGQNYMKLLFSKSHHPTIQQRHITNILPPLSLNDFTSLELNRHQVESLSWMIRLERAIGDGTLFLGNYESHISLFKKNGIELYLDGNPHNGQTFGMLNHRRQQSQTDDKFETSKITVKGGILADDMGLGKTIVALGLCVKNKCPTPTMIMNLDEMNLHRYCKPSRATVIFCPSHLVKQWVDEIEKNLINGREMKIIQLTTFRNCKKSVCRDFIDANFIIVSTQLLNNKNYISNNGRITTMRRKVGNNNEITNYPITCSLKNLAHRQEYLMERRKCSVGGGGGGEEAFVALQDFYFYRIILDESHDILKVNYLSALIDQMQSRYRWCISGTPFPNVSLIPAVQQFLQLGTKIIRYHNTSQYSNNSDDGDGKYFRKCEPSRKFCYTFHPKPHMIFDCDRKNRQLELFVPSIAKFNSVTFSNLIWQTRKEDLVDENGKCHLFPDFVEQCILIKMNEMEMLLYDCCQVLKKKTQFVNKITNIQFMFNTIHRLVSGNSRSAMITFAKQHESEETSPFHTYSQSLIAFRKMLVNVILDHVDFLGNKISFTRNSIMNFDHDKTKYLLRRAESKLKSMEEIVEIEEEYIDKLSKIDKTNKLGTDNHRLIEEKSHKAGMKLLLSRYFQWCKLSNTRPTISTTTLKKVTHHWSRDNVDQLMNCMENHWLIEWVDGALIDRERFVDDGTPRRTRTMILKKCLERERKLELSVDFSSSCLTDIRDYRIVYGGKIAGLIKFLNEQVWSNTTEGVKVILFSQYQDTLQHLAHVFDKRGIKHYTVKGSVYTRRRAIDTFTIADGNGAKKMVIMLSSENCASGTNLIEADYVILLDQLLMNGGNRSADFVSTQERQAIGRAVRMGQDKVIKVVRLVIKDTDEHRLYMKIKRK